ncbi:MAG: glycosyltransferase [Bacteroidales bacterium]|jgi:glycosyltransferase involved in cell wall biosynthesis|nr:glycosyltransferase [Bacteroidales bacterium]
MKSVVILGTAYPYRGGLASFVEMLARTFGKQSRQTDIITFRLQYPEWLFPGKTQFSESPAPDGLHITRMVNSVNPFNWWRVGRHIRKMRPDAVILKYWTPFMAPCLGTICRMVSKNRHTVILTQLDNVIPHEKHFYDRILTRYFVGSVHGFVYMSQQVKDDLDTFTTTKPSVFAPHPVFSNFGEKVPRNEACRRLKLPEDGRYILFFGLIRDYKGLDLMLDAWANLRQNKQTEGKKLIIAGEFYTNKTKYLQQIECLGIGEDVLLHDRFIRDEEVKYYFSAADMVVQPYKSATQSGVTQIAYQFETPMIVTNVGGLAEIVCDGKTGYAVEPDARLIARAIGKMYENGNLQRMAENMITEKRRFSWDYFAEQVEKLYETVIRLHSRK